MIDYSLDRATNSIEELNLLGVKCPLNFVKAKLALEKLETGAQLNIVLDLGESVESVSKSLIEEGYEILESKEKETYFEILVLNK